MNTLRSANTTRPLANDTDRPTRWLRSRVLAQLDRLEGGEIILIEGHHRHCVGQGGPLTTTLAIHDSRMWKRMALSGTVGAAEAYMDGDWDADDLVALIRLLAANLERVNGEIETGTARLGRWLLAALYRLQRNSLSGSRRNVSAHYDIGNELFATFLDREHRMYSSAVFPHSEASLEEASTYKLDLMLEQLDVRLWVGNKVSSI